MTVLIASLFLPYTVHFDLPKNETSTTKTRSSSLSVESEGGRKSLLNLSIPTSLGEASTDSHSFESTSPTSLLLNRKRPGPIQDLSIVQKFPLGKSVARNVPHSPAWGRTEYFTQPQLHVSNELPPQSVLQRNMRETALPPLSNDASRSSSIERALNIAKWYIQPAEQGNGGLRNAIYAAMREGSLQDVAWIGTLGMPTDALDVETKAAILEKLGSDFESVVVYPKDSDVYGHYAHFCKNILWPVLHSQIPDHPKSKAYLDNSWIYYLAVNRLFADKIITRYRKGDVIWVHDYHLCLVPQMVRKKVPEAKIGFFLHIAFPSSEVFRCLAVRKEILEGMLGANLVGFQTKEYCHHFLQTCSRLLRAKSLPKGLQMEDRFVEVGSFPIGIDPAILQSQRNDPNVQMWLECLEKKYSGKKLIFARDRLDHTRGVRQKLLAFEQLLKTYPDLRNNVILIQIVGTHASSESDPLISEIVTRINSVYSSLTHQPLVYLEKDLEYHTYLAMLEAADVMMVTTLREGMNLSPHEYILCQDGLHSHKKHGCAILSEFIGSATVFDSVPQVNPYDTCACAQVLYNALTRTAEDRRLIWVGAYQVVITKNANRWLCTFLRELDQAYRQQSRQSTMAIPRLSVGELALEYRKSKKRFFLLDYEGTLASHVTALNVSFISPQRAVCTINDLLESAANTVYVMSGKMTRDLDMIFNRCPGLGLVAENGCHIKHPNQDWECIAEMQAVREWQRSIEKVLKYYQQRCEGSVIEMRQCSVFFDTSQAEDQEAAFKLAGECAGHLNDACQNQSIQAITYEDGLLIGSSEFTKRNAAEIILKQFECDSEANPGTPDFLLVAGDSREDEAVYQWANKLGRGGTIAYVCTVSVGTRNTAAMATLNQGVTGMLNTLQNLATANT